MTPADISEIKKRGGGHLKAPKDIINEQKHWDLCRGIDEFKKGNQTGTNLVQDEKGDLLAGIAMSLTFRGYRC
jgi:hypothetical protein